MRTKILPILVLVMFLFSMIPMALAQEDATDDADDSDNEDDAEDVDDSDDVEDADDIEDTDDADDTEEPVVGRESPVAITKRPTATTEKLRERLKERLEKLPEPARIRWEEVNQKRQETLKKIEELKAKPELAKFRKEMDFKARQIDVEKLKEAKEKYQEAKDKLLQVRGKSKEMRQNFLDSKQKRQACTENCEELEAQTLERAKEFLLNTADSMISHLEKIKTTLQSNEDLTEEEVSEMVAKIDEEIKELQEAKAKVESATTKEEVRELSKTILEAWKDISKYTLFHVGKLLNSKHGGIIVKLNHLELRLEKVLEKMEENGKDTSAIQPLVDEFNAYLEAARTSFDLAEQKFQEFRDLPEPKGEAGNKVIQEAQGYMKESRDNLKKAHEKMKEIVKDIKDANGSAELGETTTEEALEDMEEDAEEQ